MGFSVQAKELAKQFWHIYIYERNEKGIDGIRDICSSKFVITGIKDNETAIGKDEFIFELERIFFRPFHFTIAEEDYKFVSSGRNSGVVYGELSIQCVNDRDNMVYVTYGFSIAVNMEKKVPLLVYLHCWKIGKCDTKGRDKVLGEMGVNQKREWRGVNLYEISMNSTRDMVFGVNIETGYVCCDDKRTFDMLGVKKCIEHFEDIKEQVKRVVHPGDVHVVEALINACKNEGLSHGEVYVSDECRICYLKDGYIWCRISVIPIMEDRFFTSKVVVHVEDINRYKQNEQRVKHEALIDPLTSCYNFRGLKEKVCEHLNGKNDSGILIMFDIGDLKWINRNISYEVGDQVLFDFSSILKRYIREDDIISRTCGDNFVVFIKGNRSRESLKNTIGDIFDEFSDYIYNRTMDTSVKCYAAVAAYSKECNDFEALYKEADVKMKRVKEYGKRNYLI